MKIKYLGTAAAEGMPSLFCECQLCKRARELGKENIRSRSQMLVNDDLLIDYPPDSFYHFNLYNIDLSKINNILISHNHEDHFYPLDFAYFFKGFAKPIKSLPFTIHGSIDIYDPIKRVIESDRNQGLYFNELKAFNTYQIKDYQVTPLKANHGTENPFVYLVTHKNKTLFYCHDSGLLLEETMNYLKNDPIHIDLMSLDCTEGDKEINYEVHMNLQRNKILVNEFKNLKLIDDNTKIVLSHFSHNGTNVIYQDMVNLVKKDNFIVAYDGLEIKF